MISSIAPCNLDTRRHLKTFFKSGCGVESACCMDVVSLVRLSASLECRLPFSIGAHVVFTSL